MVTITIYASHSGFFSIVSLRACSGLLLKELKLLSDNPKAYYTMYDRKNQKNFWVLEPLSREALARYCFRKHLYVLFHEPLDILLKFDIFMITALLAEALSKHALARFFLRKHLQVNFKKHLIFFFFF